MLFFNMIINSIINLQEEAFNINEMSNENEYIYEYMNEEMEVNNESSIDVSLATDTVSRATTELHAVERNSQSTFRSAAYTANSSISSPRASPIPSTASFSIYSERATPSGRIAKKQKTQSEDIYVDAVQSIAQSLKTPLPTSINNVTDNDEPINTYMKFLGSLLKNFKCPQLKLDIMNTLVQTVINASAVDLKRTKEQV